MANGEAEGAQGRIGSRLVQADAPDTNTTSGQANGPKVADRRPRFDLRRTAVVGLGGLSTGLCLMLATSVVSNPSSFELSKASSGEINDAVRSLVLKNADELVDAAKACRAPLAVVVLRSKPGRSGKLQIRSGSYVTPVVQLGSVPTRVALPFPAPYPTGQGELILEGDISAAEVFLQPGWYSDAGAHGIAVAKVHWTPQSPC